MVALLIMSVLAMMAWQGVDGIVRTREATKERLDALLRLNTVLAQFEQDLLATQDSGALPQSLPSFDGVSLRLTRRAPDGLQLVVWSLRGGTWMRWAGPATTRGAALQDNWLASQQFIGNEPGQLRTLVGVAEWQAYCFRGSAWSNCQSSANAPDPEQPGAGQPPAAPTDPLMAVRVVLTFAEGSGLSGHVTRQILLGPQ